MPHPSHCIHPPKPPLTFRVGIVGHRPIRLGLADSQPLGNVIREILAIIGETVEQTRSNGKEMYADAPPVLRVVSPLAEGADRIFAGEAIRMGYELLSPMPFVQEEFERDFLPGKSQESHSPETFRDLLALAERTTRLVRYELDGKRDDETEAYRNNAQVVLNQSDLLVVIWDGRFLDKPGGTEETLYSAWVQQVPVLWLDAQAPHPWKVIPPGGPLPQKTDGSRCSPETSGDREELKSLIAGILDIPREITAGNGDADQLQHLKTYYAEKMPRRNYALLWKFFRNLMGANRLTFLSPRMTAIGSSRDAETDPATLPAAGHAERWLRSYYDWPDRLAENYSDRYRSGFLLTYLLSATAVGLALFPLIASWIGTEHHPGQIVFMILEALVILGIIILVFFARRRNWHGRWLDYRMTAESLRHMGLFLPLGGGKPFPGMAGHLKKYGNPTATWMTWYVQSIERAAGLPQARMDATLVRACLDQNARLLKEQLAYHENNARLYSTIEKRLHHTGEFTLWMTLVACLLHLLPVMVPSVHIPSVFGNVLTFLCGFLPALGASMAGINHQGEYKKIAKRSGAMHEQLSALADETGRLLADLSENKTAEKSHFIRLTALSRAIANLMINEVSDWKIVYQDRPPVLPA